MGTSFRDFLLTCGRPALSVFVGLVVLLMHPSSLLLGGPCWLCGSISLGCIPGEPVATGRRVAVLTALEPMPTCGASPAAKPGFSSRPSSPRRHHWLPPGQLSRKIPRPGRPPNLTHQHGLAPAVDPRRPRPGLHQPDTVTTGWRATFDTSSTARTLSRPFLNWYDTQPLKPLPPEYVSSVNSGNFLGCLLT